MSVRAGNGVTAIVGWGLPHRFLAWIFGGASPTLRKNRYSCDRVRNARTEWLSLRWCTASGETTFRHSKWNPQVSFVMCSESVRGYLRQFSGRSGYTPQ